ncbi:E3 RID-beta [Squirrel monkey adenovirus]|nr:E3 RID-beta [Squirrel monkey adenovirus]
MSKQPPQPPVQLPHSQEVEMDGMVDEQRRLLQQANERHRQHKTDAARRYADFHHCKHGVYCYVKQCHLQYNTCHNGDHELTFTLPCNRFSSAYTVGGGQAVRLGIVRGEMSGSLRCSCSNPDCLFTLLKTLCALKENCPI